jgi:glycerol-3-phosphate dehydrogenase
VWSAAAVRSRAAALAVPMPITEAVCAVLEQRASPRQALDGLLARQPKREGVE